MWFGDCVWQLQQLVWLFPIILTVKEISPGKRLNTFLLNSIKNNNSIIVLYIIIICGSIYMFRCSSVSYFLVSKRENSSSDVLLSETIWQNVCSGNVLCRLIKILVWDAFMFLLLMWKQEMKYVRNESELVYSCGFGGSLWFIGSGCVCMFGHREKCWPVLPSDFILFPFIESDLSVKQKGRMVIMCFESLRDWTDCLITTETRRVQTQNINVINYNFSSSL